MTAVLTASADGVGPLFYQWRKDGIMIPEATQFQLLLPDVTSSAAGVYDVTVSNSFGSELSENSVRLVIVDPDGRLTNVSIRSTVGPGIDAMIVGFAVEGKSLLIRGSVPFGVTDGLRDPILSVYSGEMLEGFNDSWIND